MYAGLLRSLISFLILKWTFDNWYNIFEGTSPAEKQKSLLVALPAENVSLVRSEKYELIQMKSKYASALKLRIVNWIHPVL